MELFHTSLSPFNSTLAPPPKLSLRSCDRCSGKFQSARGDARFCSSKCKQSAYRWRLAEGRVTAAPTLRPLDQAFSPQVSLVVLNPGESLQGRALSLLASGVPGNGWIIAELDGLRLVTKLFKAI